MKKNHLNINSTFSLVSICLLSIAALFTQCKYFKKSKNQQGTELARVYDTYLYLDEVLDKMPQKLHGKDSVAFVHNYAETWTKQQAVLMHAEKNLDDDQKDV